MEHPQDNVLGICSGGLILARDAHLAVNLAEILDGQGRRRGTVKLGDLVENIDCILLAALAHQKLGRLVESEDEIAGEEDEECHGTDDDDHVPPAHIARNRAAGLAILNGVTGGQGCFTSVLGSSTVGDGRCDNYTDWLPHTQQRHEVATLRRHELECNSGVDGDVAAETNACKEVDAADGSVVVLARSLDLSVPNQCMPSRWTHEKHAEDGGYEACEVESPLATDDVGYYAKRKGANAVGCQNPNPRDRNQEHSREAGIGAGEDKALPPGRHIHFLALWCEH